MKYFFRTGKKLNEAIIIKKLGINLRTITDEEVQELVSYFKVDLVTAKYLNKLKYFNENIRNDKINFNDDKERKKFEEFNKWFKGLSKNQQDCYLTLSRSLEDGKSFSISNIRNNISSLNVIEVEQSKFEKFYRKEQENYLISRILLFTGFLGSDKNFIDENFSLKLMLNSEDVKLENYDVIENLFLNSNYKKMEINVEYYKSIAELLNSKDIYYTLHLISIIDAFFNSSSTENEIINKVSLIERLLIKENGNIENQFVLKVGIILKNGAFKDVSDIDKVLKTIYSVRSYLVHGNEKKLYEQLKEIGETFGRHNLTKDKYSNKLEVLIAIEIFLDMFLKEIVIFFIKNNDFCEFLKNN